MNEVERIPEYLNGVIIQKWIEKGHLMSRETGSFVKSLRYVIEDNGSNIVIEGFGNRYAVYMERGVPAARVPFSGVPGRARRSAYIEGLIRYVQRRMGKSGSEAKGIAFAIAHKHRQVGIRIREHGQGSKFLTEAMADRGFQRVVDEVIGDIASAKIDGIMNKYFK